MDSLRRCLLLLVALLSLVSCSQRAGTVEQYVDYLYQSMNLADDVAKPRAYWEANVAKTLEVRDRMQWGVPEREFRYFVLPIRVGMEALDDFRTLYADTLCARVAGMSMEEAALEINHWCLEMATFRQSWWSPPFGRPDSRPDWPMPRTGRISTVRMPGRKSGPTDNGISWVLASLKAIWISPGSTMWLPGPMSSVRR